uniref:Polyamine modulated factor 1 n=1 Tax=Pseudonaja textilis TaxID=8673 RepID=A0A670ZL90_PSETE
MFGSSAPCIRWLSAAHKKLRSLFLKRNILCFINLIGSFPFFVPRCHLFSKCYSCLYKAHPEFTKCVYNQFISHLQNSVQEEVQALKEEGNLPVLLKSLDKLEREAKDKEGPAWRPTGIPEEDVRGAVVPYLLKQRKSLQKSLREKQERNSQLAATVLAGRQRIAEPLPLTQRLFWQWAYSLLALLSGNRCRRPEEDGDLG